ncbi:MAG: glycosyltransferase [Lachnospiraceae bacterium]|nr:glycosyltransferase [Lachnospiraceae bacterium]
MEKISVIVIAYNVEKQLKKCVQSVLNQTYSNLEIILVNDGSIDGCIRIFEQAKLIDSRVKVIDKPNEGILAARKAGVNASTGDYICFVDGDDWVEPIMYEKMLNYALQYDSQLVLSGCWRDNDEGTYSKWNAGDFPAGVYKGKDLETLKRGLIDRANFRLNGAAWNKLFEAELLKSIYKGLNVEPRIYGDDWLISYPCVLEASSVYITHEAFYHGYDRNTSYTHTKHKEIYQLISDTFNQLEKQFETNKYGVELIDKLKVIEIKEIINNLPNIIDLWIQKFVWCDDSLNGRLVLYGAGEVGESYYRQFSNSKNKEVVLWVDKNKAGNEMLGFPISKIGDISITQYDYVVIAVKDEKVVDGIRGELVSENVPREKIRWVPPMTVAEYIVEREGLFIGE